jgi:hypothetical protein
MGGKKKDSKESKGVTPEMVKVMIQLPDGTMRSVSVPKESVGTDIIKIKEKFKVEKFKNRKDWQDEKPYEVVEFGGNVMLNEGANLVWTLLCSGVGTFFTNGNARVGVGDSNSAEAQDQIGLLGANQLYKNMDSGYPQYGSGRQAVFRGTYMETEAVWDWNEWTVDNGSVGQVNINRKVQSIGTKPNTEIWRLVVTLAF